MAQREDYYKTLGIKRTATPDEIRKAYRRLARKYHPDVNPGDKSAEEKFKQLSEANDILSDPAKREVYDQYGTYSDHLRDARPGQSSGPGSTGPGSTGPDFNFNWGATSREAGDSGAAGARRPGGASTWDMINEMLRGQRSDGQSTQPQRGQDLEVPIVLTFEESINGLTTHINVRRNEACGQCQGTGESNERTSNQISCTSCSGTGKVSAGTGFLRFDQDCADCKGTGLRRRPCPSCRGSRITVRTETVKVPIPAGVNTGSRVRIAGRGHAGLHGGPAGDLFIIPNVSPHPIFTRKGDNIYCVIPVTVPEAALGAKIEVPTVNGKALLRIPPGTQTSQLFRLREKGAPSLRGNTRGDQYVEVRITLPKIIDEDSKNILREFARRNPENPRTELGLE